jgi:hypothetical protein
LFLEAAAAVWGMGIFNEYLKGKKFIFYKYHKPLEKMGHLHTKTMNRWQAALLEHDFFIQYKKGEVTYPDFLQPIRTQSQRSPNALTPFSRTSLTSNEPTWICNE